MDASEHGSAIPDLPAARRLFGAVHGPDTDDDAVDTGVAGPELEIEGVGVEAPLGAGGGGGRNPLARLGEAG